jgi:diguanylate cyclase (GGDEF)-like protein
VGACPRLRNRGVDPQSALCVPVTILGRPVGVIHSTGPVGRPASGSTIREIEGLALQAGSRIGVLRAMSQSQLQAATDPLTGLLNRRSLEDRVRTLHDSGQPYAVAFADLDHFKDLNDTFGHDAGDRALRLFAAVLRRVVRDGDIVARFGGEEFVVVLAGGDVDSAGPILRRIREELALAVTGGDVPPFTASFGLVDSSYDGELAELLRTADVGLLQAKSDGRDCVVTPDRVDSVLHLVRADPTN